MFGAVLIANRGEIACRVIRTCRRLGVRTVAVHSEADAGALHVELADEAHPIGPAPASQSYLDIDAILGAVRSSGADAVHPGYGFLSESARFAEAVRDAGVRFVGPAPETISDMGDKVRAREIARRAGFPLVEGTPALGDGDEAAAAATELGYPVLVKASGGGGGIGMSVARDESELRRAFDAVRSRADRFFGNPDVYLERYLDRPRHVEIQVFGDGRGGAVHLFERDCSVQRRHQKVVEEGPSPALDEGLRERMTQAAVDLARSVSYEGAGTVECLVSGRDFYFLEMNTRLQVEHPVTEETTGEDLVEWQLRVAAGEGLPKEQDDITRAGHAIEMRVYAEDPVRFLPSPGTLEIFDPAAGAGVRVDAGVRQGDEVTMHYDPLLAKLVVSAPDRDVCIGRGLDAVGGFRIAGIKHNLPVHERVLRSEEFRSGRYDTTILDRLGS
ncbi:MAG TPA: biotin carboxylase N-terminal domain-containing protein [Actinomycetota bacterium]|nr:biotin carboxylase N-terminal domain-containing protein [Actinomycetota bacterium]